MHVMQQEKGEQFVKLHAGPGAFLIPNPWDAGTARILQGLGFKALATSSAAAAGTLGYRDLKISREQCLLNAKQIVDATGLPVSADLGNGFGDSPDAVAETIRLAAETGLVGCTIEDATGRTDEPLYEFDLAVERIAAAVEAARALPFPFLITARAHHLLFDSNAFEPMMKRLHAFEAAGADVLFAPALPSLDAVRTVCGAVGKPFNFMVGIKGKSFSVNDLEDAGVRRISLAASLYRAAMTAFVDAARQAREGRFDYLEQTMPPGEMNELMGI